MTRTASVTLGGLTLTVEYEVSGEHLLATLTDPEEWPEIELLKLTLPGGEDVSGLLEFVPVYERALEQIDDRERETNYGRDPDPDEAYERYRDERMEVAS